MAAMYTVEPLLGRVYVVRGIRALERVLTAVRNEVFRVLLMQPIAFFDRHGASELTNVLAIDLDTIRFCVFGCAPLPLPYCLRLSRAFAGTLFESLHTAVVGVHVNALSRCNARAGMCRVTGGCALCWKPLAAWQSSSTSHGALRLCSAQSL